MSALRRVAPLAGATFLVIGAHLAAALILVALFATVR